MRLQTGWALCLLASGDIIPLPAGDIASRLTPTFISSFTSSFSSLKALDTAPGSSAQK